MSKQTIFEQLMTCTIPVNSSAGSAVSQKGCCKDDNLTPREQLDNCTRALRRLESIVQRTDKTWDKRKEAISKLEELKEEKARLLKKYPRQLRAKNHKFDKILIDELKMRLSDSKYQAAYRQAEKIFYGEDRNES